MDEIPILLLAAGRSERMGQIKQLLPWGRDTLIAHQIRVLRKTGRPIYLVLGAHADRIIPLVESFPVEIVMNKEWEKGMGGSVASGVKRAMQVHPDAKGFMVALVDQPLIPAEHYVNMLQSFRTGFKSIVASSSQSGLEGVPALFDAVYYKELAALQGEAGAKKIIRAHRKNVIPLECEEIEEDMDTPEDYERLHALYLQQLFRKG